MYLYIELSVSVIRLFILARIPSTFYVHYTTLHHITNAASSKLPL